MTKRPMLIAAVCFVLSVLVYYYFGFYCFAASLVLCFGVVILLNRSVLNIVLYGLVFISLLVSVLSVNQKTKSVENLGEDSFTAGFIVCSEPVMKKHSYVTVKSHKNSFLKDGMKFYLYYDGADFRSGDIITAEVTSIKTDGDSNGYLLIKEVYGYLWLDKTEKIVGHDDFYYGIGKIRSSIKDYFYDNLSYDSYATLIAIMLGDKTALSQTFYDDVKTAGVSHVMAVSGLHLSVVMGLLFLVIERLVKNRYLRFVLICFSIAFICAICSFTPSVIRAGVMFVMFAVPPLFKRDTDRLSVLCLSVVLIVISSPLIILSISFQMSVAAVFALMIVAAEYIDLLKRKTHLKSGLVFAVAEILAISLFAQIFTAPFSVYTFRCVSLIAPITNLFVSFAVALVLQLGIISYLLSFLPVVSGYLLFLTDKILLYINHVIIKLGELPFSAFSVSRWFCIIPVALSVMLTAGAYYIKRRKDDAL